MTAACFRLGMTRLQPVIRLPTHQSARMQISCEQPLWSAKRKRLCAKSHSKRKRKRKQLKQPPPVPQRKAHLPSPLRPRQLQLCGPQKMEKLQSSPLANETAGTCRLLKVEVLEGLPFPAIRPPLQEQRRAGTFRLLLAEQPRLGAGICRLPLLEPLHQGGGTHRLREDGMPPLQGAGMRPARRLPRERTAGMKLQRPEPVGGLMPRRKKLNPGMTTVGDCLSVSPFEIKTENSNAHTDGTRQAWTLWERVPRRWHQQHPRQGLAGQWADSLELLQWVAQLYKRLRPARLPPPCRPEA